MHRSIVLPFILILPCITSHAQQWVEMLNDDARTVHEVKAAFDAHRLGQPYSRGKGWKQFQRWHWFMEQRTWPSGERLDPAGRRVAMEVDDARRDGEVIAQCAQRVCGIAPLAVARLHDSVPACGDV